MHRTGISCLLIAALAVSVSGLANAGITTEPARVKRGLLTDPTTEAAREVATTYLEKASAEFGLRPGDLEDTVVRDEYRSAHNGVTHVYVRQRLNGIEVVNGDSNVNIDREGRVFFAGTRFVSDLATRANANSPSIGALEALLSAAKHLELQTNDLELLQSIGGPAAEAVFSRSGISLEKIPVKLMYLPTDKGEVRLVWEAVVRLPDGQHWYDLFIDALTGEVLEKFDWIAEEAEYDVIPLPAESPLDSPQTTIIGPSDPTASPFGWHDTNGAAGGEYTDTRGNNVFAQTDLDANNFGGENRPDGGAGLVFDYLWNPDLGPTEGTNKEAAVVNLFYWNNIMHDVLYPYGFDEAAGNFQENNYGNGGAGSDPVQADALDGSGSNNANFGTPPDGNDPRMQMFIWTSPFGQMATVNSPAGIAGEYVANPSNSGGTANGLTANLAIVEDGVAPTTDGCEAISNDLTGKIALILWSGGLCNSSVFVANAAGAGAVAAIIIDNTDVPYTNFGGSALIPSVAVGLADGQLFMTTINGGGTVNVTIDDNPDSVDRDSDFDNGIIAHEYGHGVSNRLTGGRNNVNCLGHGEQAGEGWSDWWSLTLFPLPSDTRTTVRGIGNYATFRPIDGGGIRNFPYSTDMTVNPQTYVDIGATNIPHGVGEIWAAMLWEMYWNLVDRYGFDADLYGGSGGNNLAIQLVMDGMKMQPCSPTFVQARDAILAADQANNAGANECEIWNAFAKRGLGFSATAGGTGVGDEVEAFDLPDGVPAVCTATQIYRDGFESGDTSKWSASVPG